MARTVGDLFWDRLGRWGVETIFGYPGYEEMAAVCAKIVEEVAQGRRPEQARSA